MAFVTRAQWKAPALTGSALKTTAKKNRTAFAIHWGAGKTPTTRDMAIQFLLSYDRHHRNQGHGGIGYNLATDPVVGDVFEARGLDKVGAHAGGANTPNIGCVLIGGPGNLTDMGKRGLRDAYRIANAYAGKTLKVLVHSDINATSCPGTDIKNWVKAGGLTSLLPGDVTVKNITVEQVQQRLLVHGYWAGVTGVVTAEYIGSVREFQRTQNITVDAIVGAETWGLLSSPPVLPDPEPEPEPTPEPTPEPEPEPTPASGWIKKLIELLQEILDWLRGNR